MPYCALTLEHGESGELGEEFVVLLEACLCLVEESLCLVGADHLHELAEAVLAEVLREGVGGEGDRVALVLGVEREAVLALRSHAPIARPQKLSWRQIANAIHNEPIRY